MFYIIPIAGSYTRSTKYHVHKEGVIGPFVTLERIPTHIERCEDHEMHILAKRFLELVREELKREKKCPLSEYEEKCLLADAEEIFKARKRTILEAHRRELEEIEERERKEREQFKREHPEEYQEQQRRKEKERIIERCKELDRDIVWRKDEPIRLKEEAEKKKEEAQNYMELAKKCMEKAAELEQAAVISSKNVLIEIEKYETELNQLIVDNNLTEEEFEEPEQIPFS